MTPEELATLKELAARASSGRRLPVRETRELILALCEERFLTAADLGELMRRNPISLRSRFLTPMVKEGLLIRRFSNGPNRPDQAYKSKTR
jgi:ATP-dependent DNA helicase RecG